MGYLFRIYATLGISILFFLAPVSLCQADNYAMKERIVHLNIPSQSADAALTAMGQQADITVLYRHDIVKDLKTKTLVGEFKIDIAIKKLLEDTNLKAEFAPSGHLLITKDDNDEGVVTMPSNSQKKLLAAVISSISATMGAGISQAEESDEASNSVIEEVVVRGVRGSLSRALDQKRDAIGVVDGIAAEDIADFPDLNIGEALQRISGVTLTRSDNGEGRQISVRGLPADFVRTTLNGITAATSATDGSDVTRSFDFDLFASELFTGATLVKSGSADLTEGGIAATVNLKTPRPFDYGKRQAVVSVSGQRSDLRVGGEDIDPRIAVLFSDTWDEGRFGAAFSVAYSDTSSRGDLSQRFRFQNTGEAFLSNTLNGSDRDEGTADDLTQADIDAFGTLINGSPATLEQLRELESNSIIDTLPRVGPVTFQRERVGITSSFQLRPVEDLTLSADILYATYDDLRYRGILDGRTGFRRSGVEPVELNVENIDGINFLSSVVLNNIRQRSESQDERLETDFTHITLDADWRINDQWTLFSKFGFSNSEGDELRRTYIYQRDGNLYSLDLNASRDYPVFSSVGFDPLNPDDYEFSQLRYRPRVREDEEISWKVDVERAFEDQGALSAVKFGFHVSAKDVSQVRSELRGNLATFQALSGSEFGPDTPFSDISFSVNNIAPGFLPNAPSGTPTDFLITDPAIGERILPTSISPLIDNDPLSTWTVTEDTVAFYLKTTWKPSWGIVDLGTRIVRTDQNSIGTQEAGGVLEAVDIDNSYTDVLPSLNVKFDLSDDVIFRFAANKAITRPTLGQLSPGLSVFPSTLRAEGGNPRLDPFRATQYDFSIEWYFADEGLLSGTVFYKDISSFIVERGVFQVITGTNLVNGFGENVSGSEFLVDNPVNGEGGELTGLELSYQQPFGDTGFGTLINATFTDSEGAFDVDGQSVVDSLDGQSDLAYNIIAYYEKHGASIRFAYSHRSEFRDGFSTIPGLIEPFFFEDRDQLDISASYQVNNNLTVSLDALNVTGEDTRRLAEAGFVTRFAEQEPIYVIGVRYSL